MVNISDGSYPAAAEILFIYELLLAFSNITDLTSSFSSSHSLQLLQLDNSYNWSQDNGHNSYLFNLARGAPGHTVY